MSVTETECETPTFGWNPCPEPDTCGNPKRTRTISDWSAGDDTPQTKHAKKLRDMQK